MEETKLNQSEYHLLLPLGTLTMGQDYNGQLHCTLAPASGHLLSTTSPDSSRQLPLPCPRIPNAREQLQEARRFAFRSLKIIDAFPPSRRSIFIPYVIHGGETAVQLLMSCPAIAMLVAQYLQYHVSVDVEKICRMKRKDILACCGFPSAEWIVKLLGKIPVRYCSPNLLYDIKIILERNSENDIKVLQHLKQVNRLVIDVLKDRRMAAAVTPSFYQSAATHPDTDGDINARYLLNEIVRMSGSLRGQNLPKARSVNDLQRSHALCNELFNNRYYLQYKRLNFGAPPLPPLDMEEIGQTTTIRPLQNGGELFEEGRRMRHCIASYAHSIAEHDNLYAYHATSRDGENATFLLKKLSVTWKLIEINGTCNQEVSPRLEQSVIEWLEAHNSRLMELHHLVSKENGNDQVVQGTEHNRG